MKKQRKPASFVFLMGVYFFLYAPILYVVVFSFNKGASFIQWEGFSFFWYGRLFQNTTLQQCFFNSLRVAFFASCLSVVIGTMCAFLSVKREKTFFLDFFTSAPLVLPEVLIGLSFLIFFVTTEHLFGLPKGRMATTIIIAHATISLGYVTLLVRARLLESDKRLEEAALDLGARPVTVFFSITLPFLKPTLIASWFLSFTISMDDLVVASFTSGPSSSTLPILIFSSLKTGVTPEINALSSLIVLFVLLMGPFCVLWFYRTFQKKS